MPLFGLALLVASGCSSSTDEKKPSFDVVKSSLARDLAPAVAAADQTTLTSDNAAFAIDLYQTVRTQSLSVEGPKAVELPYDGGEMSMVLIAPTKSFATYESTLTGDSFRSVLAGPAPKQVRLREEGSFTLTQPLKDLGMKSAFGSADFSGISTAEKLFISHKTFLDIDEDGTEAAAATAVIGKATSAGPEPVVVNIDRPFFVSIIDRATKTVVFFGRVVEPKKAQ